MESDVGLLWLRSKEESAVEGEFFPKLFVSDLDRALCRAKKLSRVLSASIVVMGSRRCRVSGRNNPAVGSIALDLMSQTCICVARVCAAALY